MQFTVYENRQQSPILKVLLQFERNEQDAKYGARCCSIQNETFLGTFKPLCRPSHFKVVL